MSRSEDERFADILGAIEYFRVNPDLVLDIVDHQLADLAAAIRKR